MFQSPKTTKSLPSVMFYYGIFVIYFNICTASPQAFNFTSSFVNPALELTVKNVFDIDNILPRYIIHFDCLGEPLRQGSELERILNQGIRASGELCFKFSDYHQVAVGPWKSYFMNWTLFPLCMTLRWSLILCQPCWHFVKISQYSILETPIILTTVCF